MTPENWNELRRIFTEASELDTAERPAFLDKACTDDPTMRKMVESLLVGLNRAGDFLGAPTLPATPVTDATSSRGPTTVLPGESPLREGPGSLIGPYKLLQVIGEGGFGTVFMAEQREPVVRRVALKIIKLGMDTRQVIARFEAERQALALMEHPNIARVFDGGATDTGRPYFVMELVKGEPITEYCDRHNLSIPERLELFEQTCTAVQHAHMKGIIHRDIKPSNVLVSSQDGKPVVKVIDFGIAKATNARLTEKTFFTEHKQLIGTPAYMSPEQAEGNPDIDTRTDVYSLGVLLYELLTGSTPFDTKRLLSAGYAEIVRVIREVQPPKPSTRLSMSADTLASVAAQRSTEPKRLGSIIRGELDWIVMRALEKERQRRYESAIGLAEDVRRFLSGEPVMAAPPSVAYRLRKYAKRNRAAIAVSLIIGSCIVIAAATAWQLREERHLSAIRDARNLAEKEAERDRAETLWAFKSLTMGMANVEQFRTELQYRRQSEHDPSELIKIWIGEDVAISQALENAVIVLRDPVPELPPSRRASILIACAQHLVRLDRSELALDAARIALTIRKDIYKADHLRIVEALVVLAGAQHDLQQYTNAERALVDTVSLCRRLFNTDNLIIAEALSNLALVVQSQKRFAEAEALFQESLQMYNRLLPGGSVDTGTVIKNIANLYHDSGRVEESEPLFAQALDMRRRSLQGDHPLVAISYLNLASVRVELGRADEAVEPARFGYELTVRHPDWRDDVRAAARDTYLAVLRKLDKKAEALAVLMSTKPARDSMNEELLNHASKLARLAYDVLSLQTPEAARESVEMLRECVQIRRELIPDDEPNSWTKYNSFSLLGEAILANVGIWPSGALAAASTTQPTADAVHAAFSEAEPLLVKGWERMKDDTHLASDAGMAFARRRDALKRIVRLYEAWHELEPDQGYDVKLAEWQETLRAFEASAAYD